MARNEVISPITTRSSVAWYSLRLKLPRNLISEGIPSTNPSSVFGTDKSSSLTGATPSSPMSPMLNKNGLPTDYLEVEYKATQRPKSKQS